MSRAPLVVALSAAALGAMVVTSFADKAVAPPAGAGSAAPAAAEMPAAQVTKFLAFFDKLVDALKAAKGDCAKMVTAIDKTVDANVALLKELSALGQHGKALPPAAEQKLAARMSEVENLQKCFSDPAVEAAMRRLEDPTRPKGPSAEVRAQVKAPVAGDLEGYTKAIKGTGELLATIKTPVGTVKCQLYSDKAPMTVANFVGLATGKKTWLDPKTNKLMKNKPYYDGLVFHRVIPDFMIQGGDPTGTGAGGPGYTFGDETTTSLKMAPGVLAMANAGPSTNGSQFFITESAPSYLDGKHTIFGQCAPLDVVSKIARVKRGASDKPDTPVTMKITITRGTLEASAPAAKPVAK